MRGLIAPALLTALLCAADFPPTAKLLGPSDEPLAGLLADGEALRDAVAATAPAPKSIPQLTGVLARMGETPQGRASAVLAIGRAGDPRSSALLAAALNDPAPEVRYAAALALGRLASPGAVTRLSRALREDPSWWVRYAAAIAVGRTRKAFAVGSLAQQMRAEPHWQVRLQIVRSLQEIGGPRAAGAIAYALRDQDSGVRAAAGLALAEIGGEAELLALREAVETETDLSARSLLSRAFRRLLAK